MPAHNRLSRPSGSLVLVTQIAGIRNVHRIAFRRRDESKGMSAHVNVRDGLFDFWHVAGDALASRAPWRVMGVRFE